MARIHINSIPQAVRRLHDIYQFDSVQTISRYLYSFLIRKMGREIITGNLDDADTDLIHEMLPEIMDGLPKTYKLQSSVEPRDNKKFEEDVIIATSFAFCTLLGEVLGNVILSDIMHDSVTNEEIEVNMAKSYPCTVSYHDVGEHHYAISVRSSDDLEFDRFIADIVQHRVNHSGDVVAIFEADVSDI